MESVNTKILTTVIHGQAVRFLFAGLVVTALSAMIYTLCVVGIGIPPFAGNLIAYLAAVLVGYRLHGHWTFRQNQAQVDDTQANLRFVAGSISSLVINSIWVWLLTIHFQGPGWLPVVPMILVTPVTSFMINRYWVFTPLGGSQ
jgi:putative flippase GtrA